MAITYKIFPNERLIRVSATGIVRAKDMDDFVDALHADPALEPRLRVLYDARYSEPDIAILQLAEVAGRMQRLMDRGVIRIAMVAESKTTTRMAKTFAVLARSLGTDIEVFTQLHTAESWLQDANAGSDTEETPLPS
ncbi:MAG TPA: STAS/SEC14 domain-containing protein [Gemmatimonadaceae bacterium]|nr:STAS/SEC14 domain-containing protein [Gemmatimonadaceae bacterium]